MPKKVPAKVFIRILSLKKRKIQKHRRVQVQYSCNCQKVLGPYVVLKNLIERCIISAKSFVKDRLV